MHENLSCAVRFAGSGANLMPSMTVAGAWSDFTSDVATKEDRRKRGLAKLAAEAFDGATADVDGRFQASLA